MILLVFLVSRFSSFLHERHMRLHRLLRGGPPLRASSSRPSASLTLRFAVPDAQCTITGRLTARSPSGVAISVAATAAKAIIVASCATDSQSRITGCNSRRRRSSVDRRH